MDLKPMGDILFCARRISHQNKTAWLAMRLTAIFLVTACLHVCAKGFTQENITFSGKNLPFEKVIEVIKQQTTYVFFVNRDIIKSIKHIDLNVKNASVQDVLKECLKDQPLDFTIKDKTISIIKKEEKPKTSMKTSSPVLIDVHGRVVDENGKPVPNVTVTIKGTKRATSTDGNGEFSLKTTDRNATLIFTSVNMEAFELKVDDKTELMVSLKAKISQLDETVVIAYGTTTQRLNTGNVSSVKAADIEKQPVNNPLLALEGRVPGLFITQNTGIAGGGITVRIQGQNSFNRGTDPLYVIDGVPYVSQMLPNLSGTTGILGPNGNNNATYAPGGGGNPLSFINPSDIESIEVLKDADATAIYGSRAGNGAILITTKRGKAGKTRTDINIQQGWGKVTRFLPLLETQQYLAMRREAFINDGLPIPSIATMPTNTNYDINGAWDTTRNTDWQKTLIGGTARYTDAQISISGGNTNTNFLIGAGYHRETTVFPGDLIDHKGSLHFNINHTSINQKLRLQLLGNYMNDNNLLMGTDLTMMATRLPPDAPSLYNADGTLNWAPLTNGNSTWINPLSFLYKKYSLKSNNLISSLMISYQIFSGLELKSSFGYTNLQSNESSLSPLIAVAPERRSITNRGTIFGSNNVNSWNIEPQITYNHSIAKGTLEVLIGSTILQMNSSAQQLVGVGFNSDLVLQDIKSATSVSVARNVISEYRYNALFGRIKYNWLNKYLVSITARRDGSSRFGSDNQLHNFGSIAGGWLFYNETFIKKRLSFLSFGKLKASYGTTGNDQIGDYQFLNLYIPYNVSTTYQGVPALVPNGLPNPHLQWEETRKLQFGIDFGFLKDRLLVNLNYYYNRSSNLLQGYALPIFTGNSQIQINFPATIQNDGWELSLNSKTIATKDINWTTSLNLTIPRNKLVSFPNLATSTYASQYVIGKPVTVVRAFPLLGVDPTTGLYQFSDYNGIPTSSPVYPTDATSLININPRFYGGFQNSFSYKGFELDILFQFTKQMSPNSFYGNQPGRFISSTSSGVSGNQPVWVLDRWQNQGDLSSHQRFSASYPSSILTSYFNVATSTGGISDASFIRLKNLSLSWRLSEKWMQKMHLQNGKIYTRCQNLLTITNYKGMDPESQNNLYLPPLRVITLGIQLVL